MDISGIIILVIFSFFSLFSVISPEVCLHDQKTTQEAVEMVKAAFFRQPLKCPLQVKHRDISVHVDSVIMASILSLLSHLCFLGGKTIERKRNKETHNL